MRRSKAITRVAASQSPIPAGQTNGSITLNGLDVATLEDDESAVIDVTIVTGGTENGTQQVTLAITDDERPATFVVSSLKPTATGFTALFNRKFLTSPLNLYSTQVLAAASDVTLTGSASGAVRGSIVINTAGDGFTLSRQPVCSQAVRPAPSRS